MNSQTYLSVLTLIGLVVGLIGGLISQLTKTSHDVDGTTRRRLTNSGRWALVVSLLGFAGSFSSEIVKASIRAQETVQAKIAAALKEERERQDDQWKRQSNELAADILNKTTAALKASEDSLAANIKGFETEQQAITDSRQRVLNDNLIHETRLYGRLSATGTPLTTLTVEMTVDDVPSALLKRMREAIKAARSSPENDKKFGMLDRARAIAHEDWEAFIQSQMDQTVIQPFINWLAGDRYNSQVRHSWTRRRSSQQDGSAKPKAGQQNPPPETWVDWTNEPEKQGILALGLDNHYSALVCVGWLSKPDMFRMAEESASGSSEVRNSLAPSGILFGDEIKWHHHLLDQSTSSDIRKNRTHRPRINVDVAQRSVVLSIELDQLSLDDGLLRYAKNSATTAALPDEVVLFSWRPVAEDSTLPFDSLRVHESVPAMDARPTNEPEFRAVPRVKRHVRIQLIPNGIDQISKTYDLSLSSAGVYLEDMRHRGADGYLQLWHGRHRTTER